MCSVMDCDRPTHQRGMCRKHYFRWYRHGDPTIVHRQGKNLLELNRHRSLERRREISKKGVVARRRNGATRWLQWLLNEVRAS